MAIMICPDPCKECGGLIIHSVTDLKGKNTVYSGTAWKPEDNLCIDCYAKKYNLSLDKDCDTPR